MIRHLVHLRFKSSVSEQEKVELYGELASLSNHIDGILDFQFHKNVSVETPLVRDFLDMLWFDFRDVATRDTYLEDPTHQAIGARMVAKLEGGAAGAFVCDLEISER